MPHQRGLGESGRPPLQAFQTVGRGESKITLGQFIGTGESRRRLPGGPPKPKAPDAPAPPEPVNRQEPVIPQTNIDPKFGKGLASAVKRARTLAAAVGRKSFRIDLATPGARTRRTGISISG